MMTLEQHAKRAGRCTASIFRRVMTGKDKALRTIAREIAEDADALSKGTFVNKLENVPAIRWGEDNEEEGCAAFVLETGIDVQPGGFHLWSKHPLIGASPDRLIGEDGTLECKCPFNRDQHHTYGNGPGNAMFQVQGQLLVTGRKWAKFISYDPRERPELRLYVTHVERDEAMIAEMSQRLLMFVEQYLQPTLDFYGVDPSQFEVAA